MPPKWPDSVDEIVGGDHVVTFAHRTPAMGVVLSPLTNLRLRDRESGSATPVGSSIGMWQKLERIRQDPQVAVAFHAREHGSSDRPDYVLMQGTAQIRRIEGHDALLGPRAAGPLWDWWLSVYHDRVAVQIDVARLVVWPDLNCRGVPEVHGVPLPADPPEAQRAPAKGTAPRVNHARAGRRAARLPHVLLGWAGTDGFPVIVPVDVGGTDAGGIVLHPPPGLVPPGGRRAGLVAHSFARYTYGQNQRRHTGWLDVDPATGRALYAPHTDAGYRFPESKTLFRVLAGYETRRGLREERNAAAASSSRSSP